MKKYEKSMIEADEGVFGFTPVRRNKIPRLGAETLLLSHEGSGAQVLCVGCADEELGFSIIYRTPCLDETDANHGLEHAVVTSSRKYRGKDVFFDMANKSYSTFVNACTYPIMTCYPLCSQSQEELEKLADVYLSCLTEPDFLIEKNIFKREVLRYELRNRQEPIRLGGTVYGEDYGYLTETSSEALHNMLKCLYPDLRASFGIGGAHRHYRQLTDERIREVYERFYTFDNALIVLYGNMDFCQMLAFLHGEYLSQAVRRGVDTLGYFKERTEPGRLERVFESPAYEGDAAEFVSLLEYGIDVSQCKEEEGEKERERKGKVEREVEEEDEEQRGLHLLPFQLELMAGLLNHENSPFHRCLREEGISNKAYCGFSMENPKNFFLFGMENGEESQKDAFLRAVLKGLAETTRDGVPGEIVGAVVRERELSHCLIREGTTLGVEIADDMGLYWALTGRTDYYEQEERAFQSLKGGKGQAAIKALAKTLENPVRSALVVTVPKPGMAEELEQELEEELMGMKEAMTERQIAALIAETKAFDQWNSRPADGGAAGDSKGRCVLGYERSGNGGSGGSLNAFASFVIDPKELPEPEQPICVEKRRMDGITSYTAAVDNERAGGFRLFFNTQGVREEDLHYLSLYVMLLLELPTARHSLSELKILEVEYLSKLSIRFAFPDHKAGEHHHPMLSVKWYGMTADYEKSVELLLEILAETSFDHREEVARTIERYMADYDLSRSGDPVETAMELAGGFTDTWQLYGNHMEGQAFYRFLKRTSAFLTDNGAYKAVKEKLDKIPETILCRNGFVSMTAAASCELPRLRELARKKFSGLKVRNQTGCEGNYRLMKKPAAKTAVCVESPDQHTAMVASLDSIPGFKGRYLVYLMALGDKYLIPKLRYEGGAYDGGASFGISSGKVCFYCFGDPNVTYTLDVFAGAWDFMRSMEINQDELNGYILNAYGEATRPCGPLRRALDAMGNAMEGIDSGLTRRMIADIPKAVPADRDQAAAFLERIFHGACTVMLGNEGKLAEARERFDAFVDYRLD